MLYSAREA
jgi:hypothetical protein